MQRRPGRRAESDAFNVAPARAEEIRLADDVPLCVDLDGTLIKSDLLFEGLLRCLKGDVLHGFRALWWLLGGKARLKAEIARRAAIDIERLPVNEEFLEWVRAESRAGRRVVLCTAADRAAAEQVARRFGIFEDVFASDPSRNLAGGSKAALLAEAFGESGFDYAGNEDRDRAIWSKARKAIVVAPGLFLRRRLAGVPRVERVFHGAAKPYGALWLRALRLHQWAKNLLIFVPLMASHRALEVDALRSAFLAFLWFGLCASATYLINDLLDLDADRTHKRKRQRPFASGDLSIVQGMLVALALLSAAFIGAALTVDVLFVAVLGMYTLGTLWYSFALKQIAMVDVLTLAGLYTLRVIAGSAAIEVEPSFWLLAFSMFVFLSLATVKRYTELRFARSSGRSHAAGRGYRTDDLPLLLSCGTSAGFVAVLVLALYVNLGATELYRYPQLLWLLCPLVLYWICRVWRKAHRDELHDDPLVFAVTDRPSLAVVSICLLLTWLATWAGLG